MKLKEYSIKVILNNQNQSGAYVACPYFENYKYSWLRDGSFIAYSMLVSNQIDSCKKFLHWVNNVILRYKDKVKNISSKLKNGEKLIATDFLPTRYTLQGFEVRDDWPNFQIDGYGAWLWCLSEYINITKDEYLIVEFQESIRITLDYLEMVWKMPNYDCWEENGTKIHPSTLACVYGGIRGINRYLGEIELYNLAEEIKKFILEEGTKDGRFIKYIGSDSIDSSLLWLSVPFSVVDPNNPIMKKTVKLIEEKLYEDGGVKRYPEDTYYGGGQWILLTCWLGWYYLSINKIDKAKKIIEWVENQSDEKGNLPEQVLYITNNPEYIKYWEEKWGKVAKPLLWSHAMYLILLNEIENKIRQKKN